MAVQNLADPKEDQDLHSSISMAPTTPLPRESVPACKPDLLAKAEEDRGPPALSPSHDTAPMAARTPPPAAPCEVQESTALLMPAFELSSKAAPARHAPALQQWLLRAAHVTLVLPSSKVWGNGLLCGATCQFIFSLAAMFVKLMGNRVPLLEFTVHRSVVSWLFTLLAAWHIGLSPVMGHTRNMPRLGVRGLFGALAMIAYYAAMYCLPLSDAVVLGLLHPPMTAIISWPVLKEPLGWKGWLGCLLSLTGVVVLAQPPFLFGGKQQAASQLDDLEVDTSHSTATGLSVRAWGIIFGVVSASMQACSNIIYKFIAHLEHPMTVALWFHIIALGMAVVPLGLGWPNAATMPSFVDNMLLLGVACCSFGGHLLMSRAFQLLPAAIAASFAFTVVAWAYLYEVTIFHDPITLFGMLGTALISAGMACVLWRTAPATRPAATSAAGQGVAQDRPLLQSKRLSMVPEGSEHDWDEHEPDVAGHLTPERQRNGSASHGGS